MTTDAEICEPTGPGSSVIWWGKAKQVSMPAKTKDYTYMQNKKLIKPQYHEYRGRMVKAKATNYMPNEYWDFSKSGKENAVAYLEMCVGNNKRPKFYKLLQNNGDGSYSLKADGSTDGYWKLLIDFKMYDNDGVGSPQTPVRPEFNMDEATRMLDDYKGGHSNFPVAQGIVDEFVSEYKQSHGNRMYSARRKSADGFDYSGLNWASDLGIITAKDKAIFERTINNEIYRGAKPQSANGEYIIDTGKRLMFTDGDFHAPTLSCVVEFATEYESLTADAKEMLIDEAKTAGDLQKSISVIEKMFGSGVVGLHDRPDGNSYGGKNRRRKGTNGKRTPQRAKSLKERLAEESLEYLLDDEGEFTEIQLQDRSSAPVTNRTLLANALESTAQHELEVERIWEFSFRKG